MIERLELFFQPQQTLTAGDMNKIIEKVNEIINNVNNTTITVDGEDGQPNVTKYKTGFYFAGSNYGTDRDGVWGGEFPMLALYKIAKVWDPTHTYSKDVDLALSSKYYPSSDIFTHSEKYSVACNHSYRDEEGILVLTCDQDGSTELTSNTISNPTGVPTIFDVYYDLNYYGNKSRYYGKLYGGSGGDPCLMDAGTRTATTTYLNIGIDSEPITPDTVLSSLVVSLKADHSLVGASCVIRNVSWSDFIANPQLYIDRVNSHDLDKINNNDINAAITARENAFAEKLRWLINDYATYHNIDIDTEEMPSYFLDEDRITEYINEKAAYYKNRNLSLGDTGSVINNYVTRMDWLLFEYYEEWVDSRGRGPWIGRKPSIREAYQGLNSNNVWETYRETLANIIDNNDDLKERFSKYYCLEDPIDWHEGHDSVKGKGPIWEARNVYSSLGTLPEVFTDDTKVGTNDILVILKKNTYIPGNARAFSCRMSSPSEQSIQLPIEKDKLFERTNSVNSEKWVDNIASDYVAPSHLLKTLNGAKMYIKINPEQTVTDPNGNTYSRYGCDTLDIFAFQPNVDIWLYDINWGSAYGI